MAACEGEDPQVVPHGSVWRKRAREFFRLAVEARWGAGGRGQCESATSSRMLRVDPSRVGSRGSQRVSHVDPDARVAASRRLLRGQVRGRYLGRHSGSPFEGVASARGPRLDSGPPAQGPRAQTRPRIDGRRGPELDHRSGLPLKEPRVKEAESGNRRLLRVAAAGPDVVPGRHLVVVGEPGVAPGQSGGWDSIPGRRSPRPGTADCRESHLQSRKLPCRRRVAA